jgi:hypothetical protein
MEMMQASIVGSDSETTTAIAIVEPIDALDRAVPSTDASEATPRTPTKKNKAGKSKTESAGPAYEHVPRFQSGDESKRLYAMLNTFSFDVNEDARGEDACYFGKSYTLNGGPRADEIPTMPEVLLPLTKLVAEVAQSPANYIQIHRMKPTTGVRPHKDPAGMIVPMLTVGHARTFRVGGTMPSGYYRMRQSQRKIEKHVPEAEILMMPGDLLIFNGGHILHSMFPVAQDPNFEPGGYEVRYSLLFRWTTDEMRDFGTRQEVLKGTRHTESYREAIENYRNDLTDFLGRPVQ